MKDKGEAVPREAGATVRRRLVDELREGPLSAKDLSGLVGIPEKDVYEHLEHIRTSLHRTGRRFFVRPAECAHCGFVFEKRERLGKPGKCPVCRKGPVHPPLFSVSET
jgi:predicted Zn-ribbon and HTH transcriptional regulator